MNNLELFGEMPSAVFTQCSHIPENNNCQFCPLGVKGDRKRSGMGKEESQADIKKYVI